MFSTMYQSYEALRPKTRAEQREIDRLTGEFAKAAAGLWRALAASGHSLRLARRAGPHREAPAQSPQPRPLNRTVISPSVAADEHREMSCAAR